MTRIEKLEEANNEIQDLQIDDDIVAVFNSNPNT